MSPTVTKEGYKISRIKTLLVTGSSGLVGSECVRYFDSLGWNVVGLDNNLRRDFFGEHGDTRWNLQALQTEARRFRSVHLDVRNREAVDRLLAEVRPDFIIHCAGQPSHELAAQRPFDDFEVNAVGTLNLLEATRRSCAGAVFCFLSTNKVYGDVPNELPLIEKETRYDFADPQHWNGIAETCRIDRATHSLFGVSKTSADLLVQEYGRYFGLPTACFRGGCLTGSRHSAVELHGFLAYLVKCVTEGHTYRIFGYLGKQVRDNLHAYDVCRALEAFYHAPRCGEVYNLGGGRENSLSIREAISRAEATVGKKLAYEYVEEHRKGDHICYITDLRKFRGHYPSWEVTRSLDDLFRELAGGA